MNELEYISWKEFKKMAPSIIKLEINRIGKLTNAVQSGEDIYNALIKSRYLLNQFIECLGQTKTLPLPDSCKNRLQSAILNLSLYKNQETISETINYTLDRLNYVYNRIEMIY